MRAWQTGGVHVWIKQHLRIKAFFGTSENAVKSQVWIAVTVYVLVAIVPNASTRRIAVRTLQILSLTMFEQPRCFNCLPSTRPARFHPNSPTS